MLVEASGFFGNSNHVKKATSISIIEVEIRVCGSAHYFSSLPIRTETFPASSWITCHLDFLVSMQKWFCFMSAGDSLNMSLIKFLQFSLFRSNENYSITTQVAFLNIRLVLLKFYKTMAQFQ